MNTILNDFTQNKKYLELKNNIEKQKSSQVIVGLNSIIFKHLVEKSFKLKSFWSINRKTLQLF